MAAPLQYSCLENPMDRRSLAGFSPWDHKEQDMTEHTSKQASLSLLCHVSECPSFLRMDNFLSLNHGWHHGLKGHEFEQSPGDSEAKGSLACCSPRDCKGLDTTQGWNNSPSYKPHFVYPFIHQWTVELLPLLTIMNDVAITKSITIFLQDLPFNYSGYLPRSGSARSCGNSVSLFEQQPHCFPGHLPCFTFLPTGQECFTFTKVKTKVSLSPHPHQQLLSYFFSQQPS